MDMGFQILLSLVFTILTPSSTAQLVGCDNVQCPKNPQNSILANCQLGSIVAQNIGVANLTTSLSPQPLTWTIGQSDNASVLTSIASVDFYLGQPPSLNLQLESGTPDCALFFHGIAPSLKFPNTSGIDQGKASGACADVFTLPCIEDLQNQVAEVLSANISVDCSSLAAILHSTAPTSCLVQNGDWGEVSGKSISGADVPAPLSLSDCHPTIESDYSLTHIDGVSSSPVQTYGTAFDNFALGITPILTIFRNASFSKPETHLTCLKVIVGDLETGNSLISGSTVPVPDLILVCSALLGLSFLSFL